MKTDIKTLIAALTTERNAIDRAITGLKQMSDVRDGADVPAPRQAAKVTRQRTVRSAPLPAHAKAIIVSRMQAAGDNGDRRAIAEQCAREFGGRATSIATNWRFWKQTSANGNDPQPASNASAIGVN